MFAFILLMNFLILLLLCLRMFICTVLQHAEPCPKLQQPSKMLVEKHSERELTTFDNFK